MCLSMWNTSLTHSAYIEKTRYSNPLKQKFRAKRMAADSSYRISFFVIGSDDMFSSGRCRSCTRTKEARRTNARRISASQQNSLPAKPARKCHERSTYVLVLSVCTLLPLPSAFTLPDLPPVRYPNLYEVRLIPTKRDIAFVEYIDEGSAGVAKDALHNYKLDGENKIKVRFLLLQMIHLLMLLQITFARK